MKNKTGRFSGYIRPFTYVLDLMIIVLFSNLILPENLFSLYFGAFVTLSWVIIAINIGFYEVYRFTKVVTILNKVALQFILFTVLCYAFFGFYESISDPKIILKYTLYSLLTITVSKLFIYYFLRRYRVIFGGNFRRVVVFGNGKSVNQLIDFFNENPDYGYLLVKVFHYEGDKRSKIEECCTFATENNIDEIYCSLNDLSTAQTNSFIDFADNNMKILKFLPDNNEVFSRNMKLDYYGYIPIISLRDIPLDDTINKAIKRTFDIVFSLVVIIFVLSWLSLILAILIKLESKGPVFFKQNRFGLNYKLFGCYKFRSMSLNEKSDTQQVETKDDPRITTVGKFIRKTSIDEMPQFLNVLLGDMSVVGPRPILISHTEMYSQKIDKFMVRHLIKPGITGLAQTSGFRGSIMEDKDIIYRIKYDIFYIENWSLLLDIKIIFMTVYKAIQGEDKAR